MTSKIELGTKVKEALEQNDLWITRKELAKMASVSEQTIYSVLKGNASYDSIVKVAKVLNIEISIT